MTRKRRRKPGTDGKLAAKLAVTKVPQEHGGALLAGGVPGHTGGTGRPLSTVKAALREAGEKRIPLLEKIADDEKQTPRDRLRSVELMLRHGMAESRLSEDWVRERLRATAEMIRDAVPPDAVVATLHRLKAIWRDND